MPITRFAKIVMSLALGLFCLLVAFDNVTDYTTNYLFVQHVMSSAIAPSPIRHFGNWPMPRSFWARR